MRVKLKLKSKVPSSAAGDSVESGVVVVVGTGVVVVGKVVVVVGTGVAVVEVVVVGPAVVAVGAQNKLC